MVFYYLISPSNVNDINFKIEMHAYENYTKYLAVNPNDQRLREIAQDEINHVNEIKRSNYFDKFNCQLYVGIHNNDLTF